MESYNSKVIIKTFLVFYNAIQYKELNIESSDSVQLDSISKLDGKLQAARRRERSRNLQRHYRRAMLRTGRSISLQYFRTQVRTERRPSSQAL